MARRSIVYEYLCCELRRCREESSRGRIMLPPGQEVTLQTDSHRRQANLSIKATIEDASTGVLIISRSLKPRRGECRRQKRLLASLLSSPHSTSAFGHFKEYTLSLLATLQSSTKSQSSLNRYGLSFQNCSLIMSQCCSAILVDSCLVFWLPRGFGNATSSSDSVMEMRVCHVRSQI